MLSRKFLRDAGDSFLVAALTVVVLDPTALLAAGSVAQLLIAATALGRAAAIAGFAAVAPRFIALRDKRSA